MKYSEYKKLKEPEYPDLLINETSNCIDDLNNFLKDSRINRFTYEQARIAIEFQEFEFTKDDFDQFEDNYAQTISDLNPDLDRVVEMMKAVNWKIRGCEVSKQNLIDEIRRMFECCMNDTHAQQSAHIGPIALETDIYYHRIAITVCGFYAEHED